MSEKVIAGFELVEKLGEGGSGSVYKARQISLDRSVALKILSSQWASNEADVERFKLEARAAAKLMHPSIVQVYEAGEFEGIYFFAMQFINGYSVSDWLSRSQKLSEKDTLLVAESIAQGLGYAWKKAQIIHCDIKPDNILIDEDGTVKVADLGLIKMAGSDTQTSAESEDMLTPNYCSPEQALDREMDCRTDIYSLGAMMYHMATGKMPFDEAEGIQPMEMHVNDYLEDPRKIVPGLSDPLCMLIRKMMAKDRNFRQKDWTEVLDDIRRVQEGEPPANSLDGSVDSTVKYFRDPAKAATGPIVLTKKPATAKKTPVRKRPPPPKKKKSPVGAILFVILLLAALGGGGLVLVNKIKNGGFTTGSKASFAELLAAAESYAKENPNDLNGAIERYNQAAQGATTTEERSVTLDALSRLTQAKQQTVTRVISDLQNRLTRMVSAKDLNAALELAQNYSGPYPDETKEIRQTVALDIKQKLRLIEDQRRQQEEFRKREEEMQARLQEEKDAAARLARLKIEAEERERERIAQERDDKLNSIPEFASLRDGFETRSMKPEADFETKKKDLAAKYLESLNKQYEVFRNQGNLDAVLAIKRERERFQEDSDWPQTADESLPSDVKNMQTQAIKYMTLFKITLDEEMDKIKKDYAAQLLDLVKKLTKEGKTEDAVLLREIWNKVLYGETTSAGTP